MSLAQSLSRRVVAPVLELLMGRRNLVRFARSLTMAARLDVPNAIGVNGELMVQRVVREHCGSGECVAFDVGANVGEWSRSLLAAAGGSSLRIHAFEPASATVRLLEEKLKPWNGKVQIVQAALSSRTGTAEFFIVGEGLGTNSLYAQAASQKAETVRLATADEYCAQNCIARIDLLKIDAEGHDLEVLRGAQQMLARRAIQVLQFEYNQRWIEARHFLKDAFDLLLPLGYHIGKITPRGIEFYPAYHFELESFREANYLACLPEWRPRFPQVKWWKLS